MTTKKTKNVVLPVEGGIPDDAEIMSVEELSAFLSMKKNTCYKLLLSRVLPSFKFGKLRRVLKSDVIAYLAANRVEAVKITGK